MNRKGGSGKGLPMERIRVLVVDDHPAVREGLRTMMELEPDLEVVAEAANGQEALQRVEEAQPNLVIMDVFMPRLGGIEATQAIKDRWPDIRVLIFTFLDTPALAQRALAAGADGYLLKDTPPELVVNAIRTVAAGGVAWGDRKARAMNREELAKRLPDLADQLMSLAEEARGLGKDRVAEQLDVAWSFLVAAAQLLEPPGGGKR